MKQKTINILSHLIADLSKMGLHKDAGEIVNLLNDLIDLHTDDEEKKPLDQALSGNGLREDGTAENLNQGISSDPRYFM